MTDNFIRLKTVIPTPTSGENQDHKEHLLNCLKSSVSWFRGKFKTNTFTANVKGIIEPNGVISIQRTGEVITFMLPENFQGLAQ